MAATWTGSTIKFTAGGDVVTNKLYLRSLHFVTAAAASTIGGTVITVKDGAGTVLFNVPLAANSSFDMPFPGEGWKVTGLELDVIPAGAEMHAFLR
jgi:hypothetical protein